MWVIQEIKLNSCGQLKLNSINNPSLNEFGDHNQSHHGNETGLILEVILTVFKSRILTDSISSI